MRRANHLQLISINIIAIVLLILLFYNSLGSYKIEHYFITAATLVMIIHIWWGTVFYIKYVSYTKNLFESIIGVLLAGLLLIAVFSLDNFIRWFLVFGTFFVFVIINYFVILFKIKEGRIRKYIKIKIKMESPVVLLFYLGTIICFVFDYWWIPVFLSMAAFFVQIPFIYLLVLRKKVYKIPLE